MSSPAQGGPSVPPKEKEKRLSKMLTRVKTVLKRADPKKRLSTMSAKAGPSTAAPAAAVASTRCVPFYIVLHSPPWPCSSTPWACIKSSCISIFSLWNRQTDSRNSTPEKAKEGESTTPTVTRVPRSQLFEERAKKLGERYGLEIKPSEWYSAEGHALRVEKPIRMRVHRECHKCGHTFGLAKECPSCKHPRCKECQRRPAKRTEAEREESRRKRAALLKERAENQPIIPDWDLSQKKVVLTRPSKKGGQDLVHKKPRQRVRRTCCQCEKLFTAGNKTCGGCEHTRCTDCPRNP